VLLGYSSAFTTIGTCPLARLLLEQKKGTRRPVKLTCCNMNMNMMWRRVSPQR